MKRPHRRTAANPHSTSPAGRVTRSWCKDTGEGLSFDHHPRAQTTRVTDALGRTTTYLWNARHDIVATIDPLGHRQDTPMDANGHLLSTTDALGRSVSYQFDHRGNATTIVDAAGHATRLAYGNTAEGTEDLPVALTDALGHTWRTAYDDRGHPTLSTDPLGRTTRTVYDAQGLPVEITDARGGTKRLDWTARGELAAYADCSGQRTFFDYDPMGRLVRSTDALGQQRHYRYDAAGRLAVLRQPDGGEQRYAWDAEGRLLAYTDPLGATTQYRYRAGGQPVERTDADGERLSYVYDLAGRLVQLVNENGALYRFGYDAADRLTDEVGFDGRHQRYGYDAAGELVHLVEAGGSDHGPGKVTRFERDVLGRLVAKRSAGRGEQGYGEECTTRYAYDPLGRLTAAENPAAQIAFAYDPAGQLLRETQTLAGIAVPRTLAHGYDALGNRSETTLPDGRSLHWLGYGSGHLHRIELEAADGGHETIADIGRDALHREVERSQGALTSRYGYDPMGRLLRHRVQTRVQTRAQALLDRAYAYDAAGNLQGRSDNRRGVQSFAYDPVGRILAAHGGPLLAPGEAERFAFDPAGNLLQPQGGETSAPRQGAKVGDNRLRVWQDLRYEYDVHGNVTRRLKGAHTDAAFEWDAEHRLKTATVTRHGVTQQTRYRYDALGRRTHKEDAFGTTHYLWDGDLMVQSSRQQKEALFVYEPGSFVPLATVQDGRTYWYQCDQIGAPLELTDAEGNIAWAADYKVWGEARVREIEGEATGTYGNETTRRPTGHGPGWSQSRQTAADALALQRQQRQPIEQPFRLQGQQFDEETGLHYNRYRYYDPGVGRFVNQDPIGLFGGINLFLYSPNPFIWIDPRGLAGSPATATHITYQGIKDGRPYVGYASMQGCQDPIDVLKYRYGSNFETFDGGQMPRIIYAGHGQEGKDTARGMEQKKFEELGGLDRTSNKQNPVGQSNKRRTEYMTAAGKNCVCGQPIKPKC